MWTVTIYYSPKTVQVYFMIITLHDHKCTYVQQRFGTMTMWLWSRFPQLNQQRRRVQLFNFADDEEKEWKKINGPNISNVAMLTNGNGTIHIHRKREYFHIFRSTSVAYRSIFVFGRFQLLFVSIPFHIFVSRSVQVSSYRKFFFSLDGYIQYINAVRCRAFTTTTATMFDRFTTVRYGLQMYSWIVSFTSVACTKTSELFFLFEFENQG